MTDQQIRLYFETTEEQARQSADVIMIELEEDGLPVAHFEVNEGSNIWAVSVYCSTEDSNALQQRLSGRLSEVHPSSPEPKWFAEQLDDVDWVTETLKDLAPVRAGRFIVHGSHDDLEPRPHEIAVRIDAGQAFGTGHHGTTAGCLELLTSAMKRKRYHNVLDLGTGSGVLAIAATKLQPVQVLATDIDPVAVAVAKQNLKINGVSKRVRCVTANGLDHRTFKDDGPFDLILANILARPLEQMAPALCRQLANGGSIILSGLLEHQKSRVLNAYRQRGLRLIAHHQMNGWLALLLG